MPRLSSQRFVALQGWQSGFVYTVIVFKLWFFLSVLLGM
jgi:hypothetical protein